MLNILSMLSITIFLFFIIIIIIDRWTPSGRRKQPYHHHTSHHHQGGGGHRHQPPAPKPSLVVYRRGPGQQQGGFGGAGSPPLLNVGFNRNNSMRQSMISQNSANGEFETVLVMGDDMNINVNGDSGVYIIQDEMFVWKNF